MLASRIGARAGPSVRQITSLRAQTHTCSPSALAQTNTSLRMYASESSQNTPKRTALYDLHVENGATFATFAGWQMPMKFGDLTALESHHHTRRNASIFDVSHMLQLRFTGPNRTEFLERIVCGDIAGLPSGGGTLSLMTNSEGGIIDDCVVVNADDHVYMVANAGCADKDLVHIKCELSAFADGGVEMEVMDTYSLIALQGPKAMDVLAKHVDEDEVVLKDLPFMASVNDVSVHGVPGCRITRCGYTGEDGFEISMPSYKAVCITRALLSEDEAANAGLAARDSLRLEAGLCLYGSDIDATTSPMEANLGWTVAKRRRTESGFVGGDIIVDQLKKKSGVRRRVGLVVDGAPARAHSKVLDMEGNEIGEITSGVPSPTLGKNIAMAYINKPHNKVGTAVQVQVRKRVQPATVTRMPFVKCNYYKP